MKSIYLLSVTIIPVTVLLLLTLRRKRGSPSPFIDVFFFPDESLVNANSLIETISSSRHSLDVCVYCFTDQKLLDAVISAHLNGVAVRVITDNEEQNKSRILQLRAAGIQVRTDKSGFFMHHKFSIVDGETLLTGSLNWTSQGLHGNQENVIVTNRKEIVKPFVLQFDKLWNFYNP